MKFQILKCKYLIFDIVYFQLRKREFDWSRDLFSQLKKRKQIFILQNFVKLANHRMTFQEHEISAKFDSKTQYQIKSNQNKSNSYPQNNVSTLIHCQKSKDWFIKIQTRTVVTLLLFWFEFLWISLYIDSSFSMFSFFVLPVWQSKSIMTMMAIWIVEFSSGGTNLEIFLTSY